MTVREVKLIRVMEHLLAGNDEAADRIRKRLDASGVLAINVIAGPGAGKTSLIAAVLRALTGRARVGVVEGDIAGIVDTQTVLAAGARDAVQINTGGNCHLEANMVDRALERIDLGGLDLLFVENVGNLICPTHWALGEHLKLCLLGASEGHDKPVKYPEIFARADIVVLNKIDLIEAVEFDREFFTGAVRALNQQAPIFELSCKKNLGIDRFADWLIERMIENRLNLTPA